MITGHTPFWNAEGVFGILHSKVNYDPPLVSQYRSIPGDLEGRIAQTLSRDVSLRPKTARAVLSGLETEISKL